MKKKSVNLQGQKLQLNKITIVGLSIESSKYIGGGTTDPIVNKPTIPLPPPPKPQPEPKPSTVSTVSRDSLIGGHDCTVTGG